MSRRQQQQNRRLDNDPQLREKIVNALEECNTIIEVMSRLGMSHKTLRRYATMFGVWKSQHPTHIVVPLDEILEGKHPWYSGQSLKDRLLRSNLKKNECEICGTCSWCDKPLSCQLDHIDGNNTNHRIENLRILCPNCHSQTPTFCKKKS